ncbi:MAG: type II toxin-antitoxin system VapC family toxin [Solirubrobacteraceae bacterium]
MAAVTLVDSSAWVEYLRGTGSAVHRAVTTRLEAGSELASTDVVSMEILAGARSDKERDSLRRLLQGCAQMPVDGPNDYERAADLYRACRRRGETPRKLTDCLIAAVAIRNKVEVLHSDSDFVTIARHTPLRLAEI